MSVLLETALGDLVIDLDIEGSPLLSENFLKLVKARYYTGVLIYNVQENRFCQLGDPKGDGTGGSSIYGLLDSTLNHKEESLSTKRFLKADTTGIRELTKDEKTQKGIVAMVEMGETDTIGSQIVITLQSGTSMALDNISSRFLSLGKVVEDGIISNPENTNIPNETNSVLDKINSLYCDKEGRPYTDIRIKKALIIHDPYPDPEGMDKLLIARGMTLQDKDKEQYQVLSSPQRIKPQEEIVPERMSTEQIDQYNKEYEITPEEQYELLKKKEAKSRAVVLEMLGDLPSADVKAPENVLFVCKLNPVTQDEDLDLIFSRFDPNAKTEIIRDTETGQSLNYAFVEFSTKEQCTEAYLKMNNALVDDRRIKVDFSQSVSKEWNKYTQQLRKGRKQYTNYKNNGYTSTAKRYPNKQYQSKGQGYYDRTNTSRNKGRQSNGINNEKRDSNYRESHDIHDHNERRKTNDIIYSSDDSYSKHRRHRKHTHKRVKHDSRKSKRDRRKRSHQRRSSHDSPNQHDDREDDSYDSASESNERHRRRSKHSKETTSRRKRHHSSSSHHHGRSRSQERDRDRSRDRNRERSRSKSRSRSDRVKHRDGKRSRHRN